MTRVRPWTSAVAGMNASVTLIGRPTASRCATILPQASATAIYDLLIAGGRVVGIRDTAAQRRPGPRAGGGVSEGMFSRALLPE